VVIRVPERALTAVHDLACVGRRCDAAAAAEGEDASGVYFHAGGEPAANDAGTTPDRQQPRWNVFLSGGLRRE